MFTSLLTASVGVAVGPASVAGMERGASSFSDDVQAVMSRLKAAAQGGGMEHGLEVAAQQALIEAASQRAPMELGLAQQALVEAAVQQMPLEVKGEMGSHPTEESADEACARGVRGTDVLKMKTDVLEPHIEDIDEVGEDHHPTQLNTQPNPPAKPRSDPIQPPCKFQAIPTYIPNPSQSHPDPQIILNMN